MGDSKALITASVHDRTESILLAHGPNWTDDEKYWNGEGMFVIHARSLEEQRIGASDAMDQ